MQEMKRASGSFEVSMKPEIEQKWGELTSGRYTFAKTFSGDLEAASTVEMLTVGAVAEAGAYVAMERIEGTLAGVSGAFFVTHRGFRSADSQSLELIVVPGCGSGGLEGITGTMTIRVEGKQHFYDFDYDLKT